MKNLFVLDLLKEKLVGKTIELFKVEICPSFSAIYYEWEHFPKKGHYIEKISKGVVNKVEIEELYCGDLSNEDVVYKEGIALSVEIEGKIQIISLTLSEPLNIL